MSLAELGRLAGRPPILLIVVCSSYILPNFICFKKACAPEHVGKYFTEQVARVHSLPSADSVLLPFCSIQGRAQHACDPQHLRRLPASCPSHPGLGPAGGAAHTDHAQEGRRDGLPQLPPHRCPPLLPHQGPPRATGHPHRERTLQAAGDARERFPSLRWAQAREQHGTGVQVLRNVQSIQGGEGRIVGVFKQYQDAVVQVLSSESWSLVVCTGKGMGMGGRVV